VRELEYFIFPYFKFPYFIEFNVSSTRTERAQLVNN